MGLDNVIDNSKKKLFDILLDKLKVKVADLQYTNKNLHIILKYAIEYVEDVPVSSLEKKDFCVRLVKSLFTEMEEGNEKDALLLLVDNGTIGNLIDLVVSSSKGKLNINLANKSAIGFMQACIPYTITKRCLKVDA